MVSAASSSRRFQQPHRHLGMPLFIGEVQRGVADHVRKVDVGPRLQVLPHPQPWYLLDFGPMVRGKPDGPAAADLTTSYDVFFDMKSLRAAVPILTMQVTWRSYEATWR